MNFHDTYVVEHLKKRVSQLETDLVSERHRRENGDMVLVFITASNILLLSLDLVRQVAGS